ncbi:MarR family winged helix-turn-helix transcriptional regulator [Alkaliphilus transvaalensis]|uniref:MarR family winged helix-turn-helix transcriptional regulator n=1 Tax=Alkaliphilus transvaalensis TaxID=114628 RepID=UPI0006866AB1|nr:MarR family transcriptional regulator [Alkaliphilus transvaalensis]
MNEKESVGRYLSFIYRTSQNFIAKELEHHSLGSGQYIYLLALYRKDGIIQDTLADEIKVDKATAARSLKKLEEEGYIFRKKSASDKRAFEIYLTDKGKQFEPILNDILCRWMKLVLKDFTEEEKDLLLILLKKMFLNLQFASEGSLHNESAQ